MVRCELKLLMLIDHILLSQNVVFSDFVLIQLRILVIKNYALSTEESLKIDAALK